VGSSEGVNRALATQGAQVLYQDTEILIHYQDPIRRRNHWGYMLLQAALCELISDDSIYC